MPQNSQIAFAIITYYPKWYTGKLRSIKHTDKIRGDLALEFCLACSSLGFHLVVADGKSTSTFTKALSNIPNVIVRNSRSQKRSPQKRLAYKIASKIIGVKIIIATEPEKLSLLESVDKITQPILKGQADIVIPKRNDKLFQQTYPTYMYESEIEGIKLYNEFLELYKLMPKNSADLDLFFGPHAFRNDPKILKLFMKKYSLKIGKVTLPKEYFDPEQQSNTGYFPIVEAMRKKLRIASVEIPFEYPNLQKQNEEIGNREFFEEKRRAQRLSLILELIHFLGTI